MDLLYKLFASLKCSEGLERAQWLRVMAAVPEAGGMLPTPWGSQSLLTKAKDCCPRLGSSVPAHREVFIVSFLGREGKVRGDKIKIKCSGNWSKIRIHYKYWLPHFLSSWWRKNNCFCCSSCFYSGIPRELEKKTWKNGHFYLYFKGDCSKDKRRPTLGRMKRSRSSQAPKKNKHIFYS